MPANHNVPHTPEARAKISAARRGQPLLAKRRQPIVVDGVECFRCATCAGVFTRDSYYRNKRSPLGIKSECKTCHSKTAISTRDPATTRLAKIRNEAARRARSANAKGAVSKNYLGQLARLFGSTCLKCGRADGLQWDHVVPLSKGGDHCVSNLQRLCRRCNETKQAHTADYRSQQQNVWALTFKKVEATHA